MDSCLGVCLAWTSDDIRLVTIELCQWSLVQGCHYQMINDDDSVERIQTYLMQSCQMLIESPSFDQLQETGLICN